MRETARHLGLHLGRRALFGSLVFTGLVIAVATTPQLLGTQVGQALDGLGSARPAPLWLAAACFVASLLCSALAWRAALGLCGGALAPADAAARYAAGSLVNTLAPARLGDAVRVALFSRALGRPSAMWTTSGCFGAICAARWLTLAALMAAGWALGALPLWPVAVLAGLVAAVAGVSVAARGRPACGRLAHVLDALRELGRSPRRAVGVVGWIAGATLARFAATAAVAAALGVPSPLTAAVIILPALDLAGILPLTPGNVGITSGAVAMALQAHGVGLTTALTAGIAFHAVETAAGLVCGLAGTLLLVQGPAVGLRRWSLVAAGAAGCLALVTAFGATVLVPLV